MRRAVAGLLLAACAAAPKEEADNGLQALRVRGNAAVATRDLKAAARRELRAFLDHGRRKADAADAAWAMEQVLREEGFPHGRVEFTLENGGLVLTVREGPRAEVGTVALEGLEALDPKDLLAYFPKAGARFRQADVDRAVEDVERHALLLGFLRVRVDKARVAFNDARTVADVTVTVREGRRYVIAAVEFEGVEPIDLGLAGQPFHVRRPAAAAARVRRRLLDDGHQFAVVRGSAAVDDETGEVTIRIVAEAGPEVRLRDVHLEGLQRTRPRFLRRRIPFAPEQVISQKLLDKAADNLYRSRLFSAVRAKLEPVGEDHADLRVQLEELKARSVDFEAGYGSYEQLRGGVRFRDENLFGIGRRLQTGLTASLKSFGFDARVEDPYLLGNRNVLGVGFNVFQREEPTFDLQEFEFDVSVRRRFNERWSAHGGYKFSAREAKNLTGVLTPAEEQGFVRTAGLFAGARRDSRDSLIHPLKGSITEFGLLYSTPVLGADLDFLEMNASWTRYKRITERSSVGLGVRLKSRAILDDRPNLPVQERLFLGGESSVRSFRENELGPVDAVGEPVGGLTAVEAHLELRTRVWKDLYAALFYDVGLVDVNAFSVHGPPGHAVGFGLRYMLPIGPIRLDFGYNPGRRFAASQDWAVHFAFGFSF